MIHGLSQSRTVPVALRRMHEPAVGNPVGLLESTRERLLGGDVAQAVEILSDGLWWLREDQPAAGWRRSVELVRGHPVMGLLHENPFARRGFVKPRGRAGDAVLIDMLLFGRAAAETHESSALGLALLERDAAMPAAVALRERREFLAALIDHVADERAMPAVLAAGCGHLREGLMSAAVQQHRVGRLVALDEDIEALALVARELGPFGVETSDRGLRAVLDGSLGRGCFDLVYATTCYDALDAASAAAVTVALFALLRPGGRLVVAGFARGQYDAGYLEAVADWFPAWRGAAEMLGLADGIDPAELAMKRLYTRRSPDIFYLELRRRNALADTMRSALAGPKGDVR